MSINAPVTPVHPRPSPSIWEKHMKRIRGLSEWQRNLMDQELVAEALEDEETKFVDGWKF